MILKYWGSNNQDISYGRKRLLSNHNEFLVLFRLRLGLFEKDLANSFYLHCVSHLSNMDSIYVSTLQMAKQRSSQPLHAEVF